MRRATRPAKACVSESKIKGSGKGLCAIVDIKKGAIIAEYKGRLRARGEKTTNRRSNIFFNDSSMLDCPETDLASYANDCIDYTRERRALLPALHSHEPFYKKHHGTTVNAMIRINDKLHRAFLIATVNIARGTEIFCHYGFEYWFTKEITQIGFAEEIAGELRDFPARLYEYPAFIAYIHEFYSGVRKIETKRYDANTMDLILHMDDETFLCMPMKDYSQQMTAIPMDQIDGLLAR